MIPDLLWRCPVCGVNDALVHRQRWLRRDEVACTACGARWRVRRQVGDNFYLAVAHPSAASPVYPPGYELSVTGWYDVMKATLRLGAIEDSAGILEDGESLYLASGAAEMWIDPGYKKLSLPHTELKPGPPSHHQVEHEAESRFAGNGRFFLTSQRFHWQGDSQPLNLPLRRVNGVYAILNPILMIVVDTALYSLHFKHESPLKWVTYADLAARQIQAENGHRIRTSHY